MDRGGAPLIVAAILLGASVVAASVLIRSSLDRGTEQLAGVQSALGTLKESVKSAAVAPPAPTRQAAQRGRPDPSRRYAVKTAGSPYVGPEKAKVEIVEFSDFQ